MRDGVCELFTRLNNDGDVLVWRLQSVLLLGEGAHAKRKERREKEVLLHKGSFLSFAKIHFFLTFNLLQKNNSVSLPLYHRCVVF